MEGSYPTRRASEQRSTNRYNQNLTSPNRYFLQASQELDASHWILQKAGLPETPTIAEWLNKILPPKSKVAFDPKLVTEAEVHEWKKEIYKEHSVEPITENLIDQVWNTNDAGKGKPEPPHETVYVLEEKYAGTRFEQKIATVRRAIEKAEGLGLVIAALDEIACKTCSDVKRNLTGSISQGCLTCEAVIYPTTRCFSLMHMSVLRR